MKLLTLIPVLLLSIACETEVAQRIQELETEDTTRIDELCIEKFESIIDQLVYADHQIVEHTAEECCEDETKGNELIDRLKRVN